MFVKHAKQVVVKCLKKIRHYKGLANVSIKQINIFTLMRIFILCVCTLIYPTIPTMCLYTISGHKDYLILMQNKKN